MGDTRSLVLQHVAESREWGQLLAGLRGTTGGGPAVAALAARAVPALRFGLPAARLLIDALQAAAWEKLHLGTWREVGAVWRDAYTLACLLAALAEMGADGPTTPPPAPPSRATAVAADVAAAGSGGASPVGSTVAAQGSGGELGEGLRRALRHLDMAALMGGPLLRPLVDALIADLQARWQQAQGPAPAAADAAAHPLDDFASAVRDAEAVALPPHSLGSRGSPVQRVHLPSLQRFAAEFMPGGAGGERGVPVLVSGAMAGWPALQRWRSAAYLRSVAGPRTVPVESGAHYLAEGWGQGLMTFSEFLDTHLLPPRLPAPGAGTPGRPAAGRSGGGSGAPADSAAPPPLAYLAQHALLDQIPALGRDVATPEYCALGGGAVRAVNAWLGPAATTTPLHTDPYHNILCQVVGRKYVRLYHPAQTPALYPYIEGLTTNSSRVDLDATGHGAFPLFPAAPFFDCLLDAGHMLYVPPGWWHYVKALTPAISVSFWWEEASAEAGEGGESD